MKCEWKSSLNDLHYRKNIFISVILLSIVLAIFFFILAFAEKRHGFIIERGWRTAMCAPEDLSVFIFSLTYSAAIIGVIYCFTKPGTALLLIRTYLVLQFFRSITLLVVPLDPPPGIIPLNDPFLHATFYNGRANLKDLFFSGHVATSLMFAFIVRNKFLKISFVAASIIIGVFIIIQRVHYVVDVITAPAFTYAAYRIAAKWNARTTALQS
ncbi:MAG: hypothetical protein HY064_17385 [Bacteroidetes bacterium]|nr:hypothetical protein [Bacteroidota bacterium]